MGNPEQSHESLGSKWTLSYHCGESCSSNMVLVVLIDPQMSGLRGEGRCWMMKVSHRLI